MEPALAIREEIENEFRASTLGELAVALAKAGDLTAAAQTIGRAFQANAKLTVDGVARGKDAVFRDIAKSQAAAEDVPGAFQTVTMIQDKQEKSRALRDIAMVRAKARDNATATKAVQQALQIAGAIQDARAKDYEVRETAMAQAAIGDVQGALQTLATVRDKDKDWPLAKIASAQAAAGNVSGALQTVAAISKSYKPETLREIAVAQAMVGDVVGGFKTAAAIEKHSEKARALADIAATQVKIGDRDGASRTFQQALQMATLSYEGANASRDILITQAKVGWPGAMQAVSAFEDNRSRADALKEIAAEQAKAGDREAASKTFQQALQAAGALKKNEYKGYAIRSIAEAQGESGDWPRSRCRAAGAPPRNR